MRRGHLLFSAVQLIFSILVVLLGLFLIGMQKAPHLRYRLGLFLSEPSFALTWVGYLVLVAGLFLLIGFSVMYKGCYYQIKMGSNRASIDMDLIRQAISVYWSAHYPHLSNEIQVRVDRKQDLNIIFELSEIPLDRKEEVLSRTEKDLTALLFSQFGYYKDFTLSILCTNHKTCS